MGEWASPGTWLWLASGGLLGLGLGPLVGRLTGLGAFHCGLCGAERAVGVGWRCRACGAWDPLGPALLAGSLALCFGLVAARFEAWPARVVVSLYAGVLLVVALLDLRHRLVYGVVTYPATALALALTPLGLNQPPWSGLLGAALGSALFGVLHLLAWRIYGSRDAFGLGDVMIAGLVGAMVGWPAVFNALVLGTVLGGLVAAGVLLARRSRQVHFAYGPALCLGALLTLLNGPGG
jgi:leader peptidase (prepilin peptidase) / N-methyltransferase